MFTIVDYGVGNLGSISNMLAYLGIPHRVSKCAADISTADRLLLPGVGAFDYGMDSLQKSGLVEALNERVLARRVPILGICLGMQIMCDGSEEGRHAGLGWFDADVRRFDVGAMNSPLPIPHMGWSEVRVKRPHPVLQGLGDQARFYFVHSYHVDCRIHDDALLEARYGYDFTAGIAKENMIAVQFHPEKSHKFGMTLLDGFSRWNYVPA